MSTDYYYHHLYYKVEFSLEKNKKLLNSILSYYDDVDIVSRMNLGDNPYSNHISDTRVDDVNTTQISGHR